MTTIQANVTGRKLVSTDEVLWSKRDLAAFLNVSESAVSKHVSAGMAAPYVKVGRLIRWVPSVAKEFYRPPNLRSA